MLKSFKVRLIAAQKLKMISTWKYINLKLWWQHLKR